LWYGSAQVENEARLEPLAEGVWVTSAPVRFLGLQLTSTMTVLRLGGGELLLHSPVALTPARQAAVDALGSVSHLMSPNTFHHLWIGDWAAAYPAARVHAASGLAKKRPDLRIDRRLAAEPELAFAAVVDEIAIAGFRLEETVLFHRPSKTLVVADLVHNLGRPDHGWTRAYTKMMGFYDRVAVSRVIRWTAFDDRRAARGSLDRILALPFERVVVGHGSPLLQDAKARLAEAYGWL
jgi:hypothetical protein